MPDADDASRIKNSGFTVFCKLYGKQFADTQSARCSKGKETAIVTVAMLPNRAAAVVVSDVPTATFTPAENRPLELNATDRIARFERRSHWNSVRTRALPGDNLRRRIIWRANLREKHRLGFGPGAARRQQMICISTGLVV